MALALIAVVDGELSEQRSRDRIRLVALLRLGKKCSLDLRGAQRHVSDDQSSGHVAHDAGSRNARGVIVPGVADKPSVQRIPSAIEPTAIVFFREGPRWRYFRHVGGRFASSFSAGTSRAGFRAQASKRSQSLA